jgi:MarR family transcriptional regulator, negative regulator of the multidrug operon emrRAB
MFYLKDLPTDTTLYEFSSLYPNMNPSAIKSCAELLRIGSVLLTVFETFFGSYGLSQGRFLTLIVMNRNPDDVISPSYLADKVGVRRATMTGLLDRLERDDMIKRLADHQDRRKIGIQLTSNGQRVLAEMLPEYYRSIAKIMAKLTEKERLDLMSLLGKVNQGLASLL